MNVFLTIDVESYRGDYNAEIEGNGLGLEFVLGALREHEARATFFMESLGVTRWGPEGTRRLCGRMIEEGHEVQLHAHPVVAKIPGFTDQYDTFWRQDREAQARLIHLAKQALQECGVPPVTVFRAGSLAANADTLAAMEENGIFFGSNRDLDRKSSIESQLNEHFPIRNDLSRAGAVMDLPVTALRSPFPFLDGRYRHLELCAVGAGELVNALCRLQRSGYACATILTHPAEFYCFRGRKAAPHWINRRRLGTFLSFMRQWPVGRLRTVGECLATVEVPVFAPPELVFNPGWSLIRVFEQAVKRGRQSGKRSYA